MNAQRKRIHASSSAGVVSSTHTLTATIDETNVVNVHGLRFSFAVEPEDANANANGTWVLSCLPRQTTPSVTPSTTSLETEVDNTVIWGCGVWTASNESPYTCEDKEFRTTRNCQSGTRVQLQVFREGVSSGQVRILSCMTYFTS